ncbi:MULTISPECIES: beta-phosphoglucomutase [unclassified Paenibacillus]|uniref:beta-phosphoglucomutase n=1 Tax=unclassified Paenibacillus TaxID=185978 RepID=UPI00240576A6|nr:MULTISPECIES: beta-phosphoglucomutase [unclassified Paenibacillus]MDF9843391.1 beta-phosphoglucomutase [Paenibacillus sp. PastF-2]MDF9849979.1 beta-phosphoglucomutase [Paenibacillus sp. PastM-2]MDF9856687.1 beta-phosphoglucomutase [Paenibacillus sp. PastF-1]MDH6481957.1 beta-phosphoglucomutase [Paenibacillus sp. PastH-2]MDH6509382.1 beta-phosphoglucomutase [Paenibacillus sp. PastM-3]
MNAQSRLQAVIFDLDGVITDTAEYHYQAWVIIAKELGIPFTREFNENLKGVSRHDSLKLLLGQAASPRDYSPEELEDLATRKNELYKELIEKVTPADVLPGISQLLSELRVHGIKAGIASASKNAFTVVHRLGMEDQFGIIVDAGKLKRNKPDPEVFLTAAAALGVKPEACIGVEDAAAGVDAIKAAGMFAVAIGPHETFPHADIVLSDTSLLTLDLLAGQFDAS